MWVLQRVTQGLQIADKVAQRRNIGSMLSAMLQAEADKRMTAEQMHEPSWLQDAAAVPLSECPVTL